MTRGPAAPKPDDLVNVHIPASSMHLRKRNIQDRGQNTLVFPETLQQTLVQAFPNLVFVQVREPSVYSRQAVRLDPRWPDGSHSPLSPGVNPSPTVHAGRPPRGAQTARHSPRAGGPDRPRGLRSSASFPCCRQPARPAQAMPALQWKVEFWYSIWLL